MQTWPSRLLERSDAPLVYLAEGNRLFLGQKTSAMSIFGCGTGRITPEGHWSFALIFIGLCRLTGRAYPHLTFLVEVCVGRHLATRRTWSDVAHEEVVCHSFQNAKDIAHVRWYQEHAREACPVAKSWPSLQTLSEKNRVEVVAISSLYRH